MAEVADAGEDHGDSEFVGGGDHFLIADRASGLDDGGGSRSGDRFQAIGKGEESVGSCDAVGEGQHGFHGAKLG
jgi:hypothetical protein